LLEHQLELGRNRTRIRDPETRPAGGDVTYGTIEGPAIGDDPSRNQRGLSIVRTVPHAMSVPVAG
jgi:hypothetical protein